MKLIKVAAATLNTTPLDWPGNKANIVAALRDARSTGVGLVCLPELCISGYGCEDMFLSPAVLDTSLHVLDEILPETRGLVACVGLPVRFAKAVFNTSCLIVDGRPVGLVAKRALAGDGIHYEPRWFKPWPVGKQTEVRLLGRDLPIGDIHFDVGGVKIGFEICEDAWIAQRPGAELSLDAVDIILNPSASHFAFGKRDVRRRLVLEGSRAFGVSYVYANLMGNEAGRAIYDGDAIIATNGATVATAPRFQYAQHHLISAVIDVDLTRTRHGWLSSYRPNVVPEPRECVQVEHELTPAQLEPPTGSPPEWEASDALKEEEFTRAVSLALFDYLRKSRSHGFVVSLSGGADSAAVTCLVALMVRLSEQELGLEGLKERLSHIPSLAHATSTSAVVHRLLTTAYQATRNSSDVTKNAASAVAGAVGARHLELSVDETVQGYIRLAEQALGRSLSWDTDDIALQNIQARARAPSVWMLSNLENKLLLSTSNRSEAAVGYATMDGDTAGGLSPIAGIDKAFLRRWLSWLETRGPVGLGPIPELSAVTVQAPTAELRPLTAKQTDEDDLMPYELLDAIERAAIRDKQSPLEVLAVMRARFGNYSVKDLGVWIDRFFKLWSRNQWKRERYAPSFHVDDANLDPKTWCRFPILSGSYARELSELAEAIKKQS